MPVFKQEEWNASKKAVTIPISRRENVDLWVSCTKTVRVFGVSEGQETLLKAGAEFRFRHSLENFEALLIKSDNSVEFGWKCVHRPRQDGEYNSGEKAPVVQLPEPGNLLLKMRQMSREHYQATRMPVLEPEDGFSFRSYEFDDDDEVLFEEEEHEQKVQAAKKAKQEAAAKARKEAEVEAGPPAPPAAPAEPPEPPSGKRQGDPPAPPIAAE